MQGNFNYRIGHEACVSAVHPTAADSGAERILLLCSSWLDRMRRNNNNKKSFFRIKKPLKDNPFGNVEMIKLNATQKL
jgi:hypothetical protein